jgi:hypothetical protein
MLLPGAVGAIAGKLGAGAAGSTLGSLIGKGAGSAATNAAGDFVGPTLAQAGITDVAKYGVGQGVGSALKNAGGQVLQQVMNGKMGGTGQPPGQGLSDAASMFGKFAGAQAANRSTAADLSMNHDQLGLAAAGNRRADESDALKKLAQTSYLLGGGSGYKPGNLGLPSFGFGPKAPSAAQVTGAQTLQDQMLARLQPGGSFQPTDINQYLKPGVAENIGNYGSLILGGIGAARNMMGSGGGSFSLPGSQNYPGTPPIVSPQTAQTMAKAPTAPPAEDTPTSQMTYDQLRSIIDPMWVGRP